jgi:hypothetical protein
MIFDNAPTLMLFSLDESLTQQEALKLKTLESLDGPPTEAQLKEKNTLLAKMESTSILNWVPIPIVTKVLQMQPESFSSTIRKRVSMIGGAPVLRGTSNVVTITFVGVDSWVMTLLVSIADQLFQINDSLPRFKYFSKEAVILGGRVLGFDHSSEADNNTHKITLTIQKGSAEEETLSKLSVKEVIEAVKVEMGTIVSGG